MVSTHSHGHFQLPQKGQYEKKYFSLSYNVWTTTDHYQFHLPYEDGISFRVDSKNWLLMLFPQCDPGKFLPLRVTKTSADTGYRQVDGNFLTILK